VMLTDGLDGLGDRGAGHRLRCGAHVGTLRCRRQAPTRALRAQPDRHRGPRMTLRSPKSDSDAVTR
jgi:hypothetical protein